MQRPVTYAGLIAILMLLAASSHALSSSESLTNLPELIHEEAECTNKEKGSTFTYGRCTEKCVEFDKDSFAKQSKKCAPLLQFGCRMVPCNEPGARKAFSCSLDTELVASTKMCPEDKIIFDGVDVRKFEKFSYKIDFRASRVLTDIYLVSDITGSMNTRRARRISTEVVQVFGKQLGVAFGVGRYGDERQLDNGFNHQIPITQDRDAVREAFKKWNANGGRNSEEANLVALHKIATEEKIRWRNKARKIIFLLGDYAGHEPTCLDGVPITRNSVIKDLNNKGITLIAVNFGSLNSSPISFPRAGCGDRRKAPRGQFTKITAGTGGDLVGSSDTGNIIRAIKNVLNKVSRTYDVDESDCSGMIKSVHRPSFPITLNPTEMQTVSTTISLKEGICDSTGNFECTLKYTEDGESIPRGTEIEFVNVGGC